ncbi:PH domain-containing protein [Longirhabdus pacifica]|uniref:PH domain-containing protein n=1 Tax=Longirhabdus pacifica TaxID=2305227 RepID=UPI001008C92F|nr:PH domain-containing protein [Longirhabdus pacifica]
MKTFNDIDLVQKQRLQPIAILFFSISYIRFLVPIAIYTVVNILDGSLNGLWLSLIVTISLVSIIGIGFLKWFRYQYYMMNHTIYVEQGVFVRKQSFISNDRIHSIDTSTNVLQKWCNVTQLQVETAGVGDKNANIVLHAITVEEAERIQQLLHKNMQNNGSHTVVDNEMKEEMNPITVSTNEKKNVSERSMTWSESLLHAATSSKVFIVIIVVVSFLYRVMDDFLSHTVFKWLNIEHLSTSVVVVLFIGLFVVLWMLASLFLLALEYKFTIKITDDALKVEKGLLERKKITIPLKSIQAIRISESVLQKIFGLVSIHVISTTYGEGGDSNESVASSYLFPALKKKEVLSFLKQFAPEYHDTNEWNRVEGKALRFFVVPYLIMSLVICMGIILFGPHIWKWFSVVIIPLFVLSSWLDYKHTGWKIENDQQLSLQRYNLLTKNKVLICKHKVQWNSMLQTPMQAKKQLASFRIAVTSNKKKKAFLLKHVDENVVQEMRGWLSKKGENN